MVSIIINEETGSEMLSKISTICFLDYDYYNYQNLLASYNVSLI